MRRAVIFCLFWLLCLGGMTAFAGSLSVYTEYSGISLSPDGQAFTTDAGVRTYERYPAGYTVYTGETAADAPTTGEHYYTEENVSEARIEKWVVSWVDSRCIHPYYNVGYFHGIQYAGTICGKRYAQGWIAYCADCGQQLTNMYIYMNSATAREICTLPGSSVYYYLCPWCGGLEQGAGYTHTCKRVSANGYTVRYAMNAPSGASVTGSMEETGHMYGNAALYEGESASEAGYGSTSLRPNDYTCDGYFFAGWNTKADGSGTAYADGEAVLNLTSVNGGTVTLYAQWVQEKETEQSGLNPIPEGGTTPDSGTGENPDPESGTVPVEESVEAPETGEDEAPDPGSGTEPEPEDEAESVPEGGTYAETEDETEEPEELILTAWIEHSREGCSGDFKSGEGGILYICVEGHAARIEVTFPGRLTEVFSELNRTFIYEEPELIREESVPFSVPLYTAPGRYQITVKAFRGDEEAVVYPVLVVSEESVLDELRTRIRNNQ